MLFTVIRRDWVRNPRNPKARLVLLLYRLSHALAMQKQKRPFVWLAGVPVLIVYRVLVEWFLCIELPAKTVVGSGLCIYHGQSLVVNDHVVIGQNCVLRHCVTIGCSMLPGGQQGPSPVIGDDVEIGSNVVILGGISIGDGAVIGAGSVVTKSVPSYAIVVGNPARILKFKDRSAECLSVNMEGEPADKVRLA